MRVDFAKESIARDHNFARGGILVYLKKFQLHPTKSAVDNISIFCSTRYQ